MNMPVPDPGPDSVDAADELDRRAKAIAALQTVVATWDDTQRGTVEALTTAIEDLNKEALRRLIRSLKDDPSAGARLRSALADPLVYGVLDFHGLLKAPLQVRIEKALDEVRPFMGTHGGNVELVAVKPPDSVEIRLVGACHGCPASSQTLTEGVEKSIRAHAPEITHILQVSRGLSEAAKNARDGMAPVEQVVHFVSPFATNAQSGWVDALGLAEVPEYGVVEHRVKDHSVLLSRVGDRVSCIDNACAHLGRPLERGHVHDGTITCPAHGFRFLLETGECLTAPEVQVKAHAVRVVGSRVQVRLET